MWCKEEYYPTKSAYLQAIDLARLCNLVLADRLDAPAFDAAVANDIVDDHIDDDFWYSSVIYAFAHLPASHRILNLMVEAHVRGSETGFVSSVAGEEVLEAQLPRAFLLGVLRRYRELREGQFCHEFVDTEVVDYHVHFDVERVMACRRKWELELLRTE
jgi:hypothetical protein